LPSACSDDRTIGGRWFPLWVIKPKDRRCRSWIGHIFRLFRGRYVVGSATLGGLLYLGGFLAADVGGFGNEYFHSPVWALAAVTAWVFAWGEWSDRALYDLPERVQLALRQPLTNKDVERWYCRFYDTPRDLVAGVALGAPVVILTFTLPEFWEKRFAGWKAHRHVAEAILTSYFVVGALLTSTMLYGLWNYLCFADDLLQSKRKLNADLHAARATLQHLTSFGLATGFGWTVAVALMAEVFARTATPVSLGLLAAFTVLGFALILMPQLLAHSALLRTRDELLGATARSLSEPPTWLRRFLFEPDELSSRLRDYLRELSEARVWIYTPPQALLFLIQIGGALSAIFLHRGGH
jgi:hypothetical protein